MRVHTAAKTACKKIHQLHVYRSAEPSLDNLVHQTVLILKQRSHIFCVARMTEIGQELYTRNTKDRNSEASAKEKRALYDAIGVEVTSLKFIIEAIFILFFVQLDVKNLNYSVVVNKKTRQLLRDVSFHLEPGEMCALMGPSGAGKRLPFVFLMTALFLIIISNIFAP
jgi:ABC-type multidrug transport system fused ATPase/permease subunit